jgi:hypothetical protein
VVDEHVPRLEPAEVRQPAQEGQGFRGTEGVDKPADVVGEEDEVGLPGVVDAQQAPAG